MPLYIVAVTVAVFCSALPIAETPAQDATKTKASSPKAVVPEGAFAVINEEVIPFDAFQDYFVGYARRKLYHGGGKEKIAALRKEAVEKFIVHRLLIQEAARLGIQGDAAAADERIGKIRQRYENDKNWPKYEKRLDEIRASLIAQSQVEQLRSRVTKVDAPDDDRLVDYYRKNLKSFTQPKATDLSVILIGVPPSSPKAGWEEAKARAEEFFQEIAANNTFADLAKQHSSHMSSADGGRLGIVHQGQLSDPAQKAVDQLAPGEVSPPVRVLEGYALFRLERRIPSQVMAFEVVRARAEDLYRRDRATQQWASFVEGLKDSAEIALVDNSIMSGSGNE